RKYKTKKPRRKDTELPQTSVPIEVIVAEAVYEEMYDSVERAATTATGLDAEQDRGIIKDRLTLTELMELCAQLQSRVLALDTTKTNQALQIGSLKRREKKIEKKASKRTHKLSILYKIGSSRRIKSSNEASLDDSEDASKEGRIIDNLDDDKGVTFVDEAQGRNDQDMFHTVTAAGVEVSAASTTPTISIDDITLAKALAAFKSSKHMSSKDKGKERMIKPKKPLKKKYQIMIDEEVVRNLDAQLQAELEEEERLARQKEEEANIALIAKCDDVQAMMDADHELAERLQAEAQGELTIKERSEEEKTTNQSSKEESDVYLSKNIVGFIHNQLKNKSFEEGQKAFNNTISWINSFVPMDKEVTERSSKRAGEKLKSDKSKKQTLDKKVEVKEDNDQEEATMKMYMKIIFDDEIALDAIPLATKPPIIVD
nr:hypothetical protein [Tanacetum cinerariifolium]